MGVRESEAARRLRSRSDSMKAVGAISPAAGGPGTVVAGGRVRRDVHDVIVRKSFSDGARHGPQRSYGLRSASDHHGDFLRIVESSRAAAPEENPGNVERPQERGQ